VEAAVRLIPGVLGDFGSARGDSFQSRWLDCAHYTRPEEFDGGRVPGVLLTGHHHNIERWRRINSICLTRRRRPDLLAQAQELQNGDLEGNNLKADKIRRSKT